MTHSVASHSTSRGELLHEGELKQEQAKEQWMLLSLASPALLVVALIILIPVGWLFYLSFIGGDGTFSLEHYEKMIKYKSYFRVFLTTFQVSLLTTLICIFIGKIIKMMPANWNNRMSTNFDTTEITLPMYQFQ